MNKEFYQRTKNKINKKTFTNGSYELYQTLVKAYEEYPEIESVDMDTLRTLHFDKYNPMITTANKRNLEDLIDIVSEQEVPSGKAIEDTLNRVYIRDKAKDLANMATDVFNGKTHNFHIIRTYLNDIDNVKEKEILPVSSNIEDIMRGVDTSNNYHFNIREMQDRIGGIGKGNFGIIFARPETGKTAFWVSLVANENGFAHQNIKVHAFVNEEPAIRTQMRLITACCGMSREEIATNVDLAKEKWSQISPNIKLYDTVDWDMSDYDSHCEQHNPDLLIIDQLDKVNVGGAYNRQDEKLREIYKQARELCKRRDCCVIGVSQASADAHDRERIGFDMMENSKTGKAAEADLIIGIGKKDDLEQTSIERHLSISKNKMSGWHGVITTQLQAELSRFVD